MEKPQFISVLHRKLKPGETYDNFYQAWLPSNLNGKDPTKESVEYFHGPVHVINAVNANDPDDIISIALIWETQEEIENDIERTKTTEEERHVRISKVSDKSEQTKFYHVMDLNFLGTKPYEDKD